MLTENPDSTKTEQKTKSFVRIVKSLGGVDSIARPPLWGVGQIPARDTLGSGGGERLPRVRGQGGGL